MRTNIGQIPINLTDVVSEGVGDTTDDIFETLSNIGEKSEKSEKEDKDEKDEDKDDPDVIPLKDKDKDKDKDEEEDEDKDEDEDEESDEEDEEDEDEDKEESVDEDELELAKIPARSQIKAKYPNIFKDFPALDKIFYREKAFAEIFPTVKEAKNARAEISEYNRIQEELLSGDVTGVLNRVKATNQKAYDKIAANIIDSLIKVDKESYIEPARVVIKSTLSNLYNLAGQALKKDPSNKKAEQMQIAIEMIHEGLFQSSEVTPYNRIEKEEDKVNPEVEKLRRERAQIDNEKFSDAHTRVSDRFVNSVTKTLEKNIDPKNVMTAYVKNNLIKDIKEDLDKQLTSDKRFTGVVRKLYERAREANYSQESLDSIVTALKNKASSILPDIMRAKKGEALKGTSNVKKIKTRELSRERTSESATTRNSRTDDDRKSLTRNNRSKEDDGPQPGESALEYLDRKLG